MTQEQANEAIATLCSLIDAASAQIAAARAATAELERVRQEAEAARRALGHALFHAADLADRLIASRGTMQAQATATIEPKPEQAQPPRRAPRARAAKS